MFDGLCLQTSVVAISDVIILIGIIVHCLKQLHPEQNFDQKLKAINSQFSYPEYLIFTNLLRYPKNIYCRVNVPVNMSYCCLGINGVGSL